MKLVHRMPPGAKRLLLWIVCALGSPFAFCEHVLNKMLGPANTPGDLRGRDDLVNQMAILLFVVLTGSCYLYMRASGIVN